ncbi:methyltransferase domain-containing protein [Candidatus Uhrbacteria bacterium]|nr:methyltransferase domain-containing protein [Candidatus Uhrbacteria bacterium]
MVTFLIIVLLAFQVFLLFCMGVIFSLLVLGVAKVPWVPTPPRIGREMYKLIGLKPGERVLDLGCGDGSLLIAAAKEFGATGVGYELHPVLRWAARLKANLAGVGDRVEFRGGNFFRVDLPDTDVIASYLFTEVQAKLEPVLRKRYPNGLRIVSRTFPYLWLSPATASVPCGKETLYAYRLPPAGETSPSPASTS